jgi:hypothetical protein
MRRGASNPSSIGNSFHKLEYLILNHRSARIIRHTENLGPPGVRMAHRAGARARDLGSVSAKEGRFAEGKGFHRLPVAAFRPAALLGSVLDVSFQARAVPLPATIICPGGDSAKGQAAVASPYRLRSAVYRSKR